MNTIITRFAPSPTGNLHLGGIRTALINFIVTQNYKKKFPNSKFLLRIEDTDKERSNKDYEKSILNGLKWLGINYDGNPFIQSKQISRHQIVAYELLKNKKAYKCICGSEDLEKIRINNLKKKINDKKICKTCEKDLSIQSLEKNFVLRVKAPVDKETIIKDLIQGKIIMQNKEIDDFIILRKDGTPTYMLSVVVDDFDMGVNLIIRGDDHLNNAFRQNIIYKGMNWDIPNYAHLPLIHGNDGKKLSKRHGAIDINDFKEKGYLKESIINNLILLGWSPLKSEEFIKIDEIIKLFNIEKISKSSSIFSYDKLNFFNNYFIQNDINYLNFHQYCKNNKVLLQYANEDKEKLLRIFLIYKKNLKFYSDLINISKIYFDKKFIVKKNSLLNEDFKLLIEKFIFSLKIIDEWNLVNLENEISKFISKEKIKFVKFGKPARLMLINFENGPSISDILYILGKKISIERIKGCISIL